MGSNLSFFMTSKSGILEMTGEFQSYMKLLLVNLKWMEIRGIKNSFPSLEI